MSFPPTVGRHRIVRLLGTGAFASVCLGNDEALDSQVAIKVLSGSLLDDLDVRNRFLEEARLLRRADSDRLVRVHDIGELPDGRPYFVMSYADRGTLADRMRDRPLPVPLALELAEEVARGVEVINVLGIIHRDLKPSNVLFQSTRDGGEKLLIADLGLAKALAHASGAFTLPVGTPGYMSPEQARFGGGLDVRADVYGLGALTYHMLSGRSPGQAPVEVPPSGRRKELSPAVDATVMRALEVDRDRRYPTAAAFAEALAELGASLAEAPAAPPAPEPMTRPDTTILDGVRAEELGSVGAQSQWSSRAGPPARQSPSAPPLAGPAHAPATSPDTPSVPPPAVGETVVDRPVAPLVERPASSRVPPPSQAPRPSDPERTVAMPLPGAGAQAATSQLPQPGPGAGPAPPAPPPVARASGRSGPSRRTTVLVAVAGAVAAVLLVAGLLINGVFSGDGPERPTGPDLPEDFVAIADGSGKIKYSVPKAWPKAAEPTWVPSSVGLSDGQARPVLRATTDVTDFKGDGDSAGVFVGLTTDVTEGRLPPPSATRHPQCTQAPPEPYQTPDKSLSGTITRYTGCSLGTANVTEIGLRNAQGTFGAWVRVKETDERKLTNAILDSMTLAAP